MSESDFKVEADKLLLMARGILAVDLDGLLGAIQRVHTIGPLVDPTKYRDALFRGDMDSVAELARSALSFKATARLVIDAARGKVEERWAAHYAACEQCVDGAEAAHLGCEDMYCGTGMALKAMVLAGASA